MATLARALIAVVLVALVGLLAVRGFERAEEGRYRRAVRAWEQARAEARRSQQRLEALRAEVEMATAKVREAELQLVERESGVGQAAQALREVASDELLFRAVQTALLEDPRLTGTAISARVEAGVVYLSGNARNEQRKQRALELAASVPGTVGVKDEIRVASSTADP